MMWKLVTTTDIPAPDLDALPFGLCTEPQQSHRDNSERHQQCRGEKAKQVTAAEEGFSRVRSRRRVRAHWNLTGLPGHVLHGCFEVRLLTVTNVCFLLSWEILWEYLLSVQDFLFT